MLISTATLATCIEDLYWRHSGNGAQLSHLLWRQVDQELASVQPDRVIEPATTEAANGLAFVMLALQEDSGNVRSTELHELLRRHVEGETLSYPQASCDTSVWLALCAIADGVPALWEYEREQPVPEGSVRFRPPAKLRIRLGLDPEDEQTTK